MISDFIPLGYSSINMKKLTTDQLHWLILSTRSSHPDLHHLFAATCYILSWRNALNSELIKQPNPKAGIMRIQRTTVDEGR